MRMQCIEYTAMLRLGSTWLASQRFTGAFGRSDPGDRWQRFLSQAHLSSEGFGASDMRTAVLANKWASATSNFYNLPRTGPPAS